MTDLRVLMAALRVSLSELPTTFTPLSWVTSWLIRSMFQVIFFALLGKFASSDAQAHYILLGNIVAVIALEVMMINTTAALDWYQGTLPFLVSAPANVGAIYLGRGLQWVVTGAVSSNLIFIITSFVFPVPWAWWQLLPMTPLLLLIGFGTYCYGCMTAAVAFRNPKYRGFFTNLGFLILAVCCGINVPVSAFPTPVEWLAQVLPLTHGLEAIRAIIDGDGAATVTAQILLELVVAAGWLVLTRLSFQPLAARGRRDGSLSFTS
ncbi:ABC transporter permease [Streptomyces sp. SP17KL33]|uniref:ABC transporter permease n=1 Tax=Streptomyces sp. SP17KL33 TaxID=3002534 RepID=UPI002E7A9D72|nr:ABC transporter permease [Streptomyces sp. SP17KL33]MEE1831720.1 ABC transporter permease [Streptomyces sp. SP17KL33]